MKNITQTRIISIGLAIFSMLFGAGNLMYPLVVGMASGRHFFWGMSGFLITAVILPLAGLIAMILFDGNYNEFFNRLGSHVGQALILLSMIVIGPLVVIPRIVTLSHIMTAPFLPFGLDVITWQTSFIFSIIFLGITFLATFRENRIVDILGYIISPLLLASLLIIIVKGFFTAHTIVPTSVTPLEAFTSNLILGYGTLDLFGAIFFSSVVLHILKNTIKGMSTYNRNALALLGFKGGIIGVSLLAVVYIGMGILGMYHGHGFGTIHAGELFRVISFQIMSTTFGSLTIATAVLMACFSTSIALGAVVGEYLQLTIFKRKLGYVTCLALVLAASIPLSTLGLATVLSLTVGPLTYIGYPIIIVLTLCNIAYKLWDFKPVKIPVLLTFAFALLSYLW